MSSAALLALRLIADIALSNQSFNTYSVETKLPLPSVSVMVPSFCDAENIISSLPFLNVNVPF
jgi:hypothetical protein